MWIIYKYFYKIPNILYRTKQVYIVTLPLKILYPSVNFSVSCGRLLFLFLKKIIIF